MKNNLLYIVIIKIRIEFNFFKKRVSSKIVQNENINKNYIRKLLPACPVIIDAGAHIGADSVEMSRLFTKAEIHAFEPAPAIFKLLLHNVRKYKNIKTYKLALSDKTGEAEFNISSGSSDGSSSLLKPESVLIDHPDISFDEKIIVRTITLDEWASNNNILKVDFLWLDLQGFELDVLKASVKIFPLVKTVHLEVSSKTTYRNAAQYPEVKEWMVSVGFRIEVEAIPNGWDMGNVLFVRNF
jgi:FkbM family methyltransferase